MTKRDERGVKGPRIAGRSRALAVARTVAAVAALAQAGCSADDDASEPSGSSESVPPMTDQTSGPQGSEGVPAGEAAALDATLFAFVDPDGGASLTTVYDASRQMFQFSREAGMTDLAGEANDPRWTAQGNDLFFTQGSDSEFRVRFGTEDGERRAYFTERAAGTICRIRLNGVDRAASIFATSELPPQGL